MALSRERAVSNESFTGASTVHDKSTKGLGAAVQSVLQKQGAVAVDAAAITALTDSSTGVDNSTVGVAAAAVVADISGGTTGVLATGAGSLDTSADTVMNAYAVLLEQANLVMAQLGAGSVLEGPGTIALSGTVAAVDKIVAANTTDNDSLDFVTFQAIQKEVQDAQATVIAVLDRCKKGVGLAVLTVATGGGSGQGEIYPDESIPVAALTNGTAVAGGVTSVLASTANAWLVDLADNIAYFATELDLVTNVVATSPLTHYAG